MYLLRNDQMHQVEVKDDWMLMRWKEKKNDNLTNMWTQCVHKIPTTIVPIAPKRRPAFLNATGIANIPIVNEKLNEF